MRIEIGGVVPSGKDPTQPAKPSTCNKEMPKDCSPKVEESLLNRGKHEAKAYENVIQRGGPSSSSS